MNVVIVSDIFGATVALKKLARELDAHCIIDPYHGIEQHFKNESDAYRHFSEHVGLDRYLEHLISQLERFDDELILIGFSIGASALWRLSALPSAANVKRAFCFYGAQIRHFSDITPRCVIDLIFPSSEPHFDVHKLQRSCAMKANTNTRKVPYLHGFMNRHSVNFDSDGYQQQLRLMRSQLASVQTHYRLATIEDIDSLATLHAQSWRATYRGIFSNGFLDNDVFQERNQAWTQRLTRPKNNQHIIVATQRGEICGFICAFAEQHPEWGTFIDNLHVASAYQGRGVAKQLICLIAQWVAQSSKPQGIYLEVLEDNLQARGFYDAIGAIHQQTNLWVPPGSEVAVKDLIYRWPRHQSLLNI